MDRNNPLWCLKQRIVGDKRVATSLILDSAVPKIVAQDPNSNDEEYYSQSDGDPNNVFGTDGGNESEDNENTDMICESESDCRETPEQDRFRTYCHACLHCLVWEVKFRLWSAEVSIVTQPFNKSTNYGSETISRDFRNSDRCFRSNKSDKQYESHLLAACSPEHHKQHDDKGQLSGRSE
ncbi:hypothetical protein FK85_15745 [Halorubrum saccharovorum]|uniref:Uncharacterized protein n=1 Tax=Halorubrum saccharovorum TaxID=2248 RepID=A0A081EWW8_9EURY|nr:hypothetical protein FK85_15745 [Halorubrum saccharovorum]